MAPAGKFLYGINVYDSKVTRGKRGAHVALYLISFDSEERLSVRCKILKLSLYVALISACGTEQKGWLLLSLLPSEIDIFKNQRFKGHVFN